MRIWKVLGLGLLVSLALGCSQEKPVHKIAADSGTANGNQDSGTGTDAEEVTYSVEVQAEGPSLTTNAGDSMKIKVFVRDNKGERVTEESGVQIQLAISDDSTASATITPAGLEYVNEVGEVEGILSVDEGTAEGFVNVEVTAFLNDQPLPGAEDAVVQQIKIDREAVQRGTIPSKIVFFYTRDGKKSPDLGGGAQMYDGEKMDLTVLVSDKQDLPVKDVAVDIEMLDVGEDVGRLIFDKNNQGVKIAGITNKFGEFSATFESVKGKQTSLVLQGAFHDTNNETVKETFALSVEQRPFGGIEFIAATPQSLGVQGSGNPVAAKVTFKVTNDEGEALSGKDVTFFIVKPDLGAVLNRRVATSNENGEVNVFLTAGFVAGPILIEATAHFNVEENGVTEKKSVTVASSRIYISSALPSTKNLVLAMEQFNIPSLGLVNDDGAVAGFPKFSLLVGDRFGNPPPQGTVVGFFAEAGNIETPGVTDAGGVASATWHSGLPPRDILPGEGNPADGFVTIMAVSVGDEFFLDHNGNGLFDAEIDTFDIHNVDEDRFFDIVNRDFDYRQVILKDNDVNKTDLYKCNLDLAQGNVQKSTPDGDYDPPICGQKSLADFHKDDLSEPFLDEDSDMLYYKVYGDIISNGRFYYRKTDQEIIDQSANPPAFSQDGLGLDGTPNIIFDGNAVRSNYVQAMADRGVFVPAVPFIDPFEFFIDDSLDNDLLTAGVPNFSTSSSYQLTEFDPPNGIPDHLKLIWASGEFALTGLPIIAFIDPNPAPVDCNGVALDPMYCRSSPQVRGTPFGGQLGRPSFNDAITWYSTTEDRTLEDGEEKTFRVYIGDVNGNPLGFGSEFDVRLYASTISIDYWAAWGFAVSTSYAGKMPDYDPEWILKHSEYNNVIFTVTVRNPATRWCRDVNVTLEVRVKSTHHSAADEVFLRFPLFFKGPPADECTLLVIDSNQSGATAPAP